MASRKTSTGQDGDHVDPLSLHRALGRLMAEVRADARLAAECDRAQREFFGAQDAATADEAMATRFAEWYLLERESEVLGDPTGRVLLRERESRDSVDEQLMDSEVGVYVAVDRGRQVARLRDLQTDEIVEVRLGSRREVRPGDLVVGRLYGEGATPRVPSAVVAIHDDGVGLARAFQADVAALGLERRLTQVELEQLMFQRWSALERTVAEAPPLEHLEAKLQSTLAAVGKGDVDVAELSAALASAPHAGGVMGPLLDEVAFDTGADLDVLRQQLLEIWNAHRVAALSALPRASEPQPPMARPTAVEDEDDSPGLGARVAARIEQGLAGAENVEELFTEIDDMVGGDTDEDDDDEPVGSFEGDLEPLVQEFLWEEDSAGGPEAEILASLVRQQREAPVPRMDVEAVESTDLLRLFLRVYLESRPAERAQRVQEVAAVVERFYSWAQRTQEYELQAVLDACRADFLGDVERVHGASLDFTSAGRPVATEAPAPSLWRVLGARGRQVELVAAGGGDPVWIACRANERAREGDLVLGAVAPGKGAPDSGEAEFSGVIVVLPSAAEVLLGQ